MRQLIEPHPDWPSGVPGHEFDSVRCLVLPGTRRDMPREALPQLEVVEGDIRDRDAVERFCAGAEGATVFHLAGSMRPRRVRELFEVNTRGTEHLIAAAARAGVKRIVATSSNSPVGESRDPSTRFDESAPYRPQMAYGRSKKLMEDALNAAHRAEMTEVVILRPCWFYGPDQPPHQTLFFKLIESGRAPIVAGGLARRSMSYVDNTVLALLLAAARPQAAGETYWIADERPYSMNEVVDTVEDLLASEFGRKVAHRRLRLPGMISEVAHGVDVALQLAGINHQKVHVLSVMNKTIACSIDKAKRELGYIPGVELREGMRRSIEYCLERGEL